MLVFEHALRVQLVRFTFYRNAGFSNMRIVESLRVFDRGISKENQNAFETFNRLVNGDVPQRIRLVDRTRFAIVDAIKHVVDRALVLVAQRLSQISVGKNSYSSVKSEMEYCADVSVLLTTLS